MSDIADVLDMDCLVSSNPLVLDLTSAFVRGPRAILQRVLNIWACYIGTIRHAPGLGLTTPVPDLEGATFSPAGLQGLRATLEAQAKQVDFVAGCVCTVTLVGGLLTIRAIITLSNNKAYVLELSVADARPVLLRLGENTAS